MNERFLRFLDRSGWKIRQTDNGDRAPLIDYVKVYEVPDCNGMSSIPIAVRFGSRVNKEGYPYGASLHFVLDTPKHTSYANSRVYINNTDVLICTLNEAGLILALKYVIFSRPVAHYKHPAKVIMENNANV